MDRHPDIGFNSYDRFFPSQDTMPAGGFGNLIAWPLQSRPREKGNSVFLDDDMKPYDDQWAYLSTVVTNRVAVDRGEGRLRGRDPWRTATLARKDGHHPIIFMQCGPIRYRADAKKQAAARPFDHIITFRPTKFQLARRSLRTKYGTI